MLVFPKGSLSVPNGLRRLAADPSTRLGREVHDAGRADDPGALILRFYHEDMGPALSAGDLKAHGLLVKGRIDGIVVHGTTDISPEAWRSLQNHHAALAEPDWAGVFAPDDLKYPAGLIQTAGGASLLPMLREKELVRWAQRGVGSATLRHPSRAKVDAWWRQFQERMDRGGWLPRREDIIAAYQVDFPDHAPISKRSLADLRKGRRDWSRPGVRQKSTIPPASSLQSNPQSPRE